MAGPLYTGGHLHVKVKPVRGNWVTKAKLEANRRNAAKSTGPKNIETTRLNAIQHGLLAHGITAFDDPTPSELMEDLNATFQPQGPLETFLVARLSLCMIRLMRASRLEAEFITDELNQP